MSKYSATQAKRFKTGCVLFGTSGVIEKLNEIEDQLTTPTHTITALTSLQKLKLNGGCPSFKNVKFGDKIDELIRTVNGGVDSVQYTKRQIDDLNRGCPILKGAMLGDKMRDLIILANA